MNQQLRHALGVLIAAASLSAAGVARADVTVEGFVSPGSPSDPWEIGASTLLVSTEQNEVGRVVVSHRGRLISGGAYVGYASYSVGVVDVIGYGTRWINNGTLDMGAAEAEGFVNIRRGAQVTTDDLNVGARIDGIGNVLVEGYDATLTSRSTTLLPRRGVGRIELRQGASFFSNNVYFGSYPSSLGIARVMGSATRWITTGEFVIGGGGVGTVDVYRGELFTANARIEGDDGSGRSYVSVSGWGGTWTNDGLLRVGGELGFGEVHVGTLGTLETQETEIRSDRGGGFVQVGDVSAAWRNSGDVTVLASNSISPSLVVQRYGTVGIGGVLRTAPLFADSPYVGPSVRIEAYGTLNAGTIEVEEGHFDFAGGYLSFGSFVGDLANTQSGQLMIGRPSVVIAGDYAQGPSASAFYFVFGANAPPILQVDGDVSLGGRLEVGTAGDTVPPFQLGDTIALLDWTGELSGEFDEVILHIALDPGLAWDTSALYTTGEITVVPAG
ncbi:hypothetical protein WME89_42990 [Sorangium sp. So ce321]|uniref:hypothetical protein n=1 Tax=Sorangium sp. So ce321 TaxID=3133300 RepID=UPI003F5FD8ED